MIIADDDVFWILAYRERMGISTTLQSFDGNDRKDPIDEGGASAGGTKPKCTVLDVTAILGWYLHDAMQDVLSFYVGRVLPSYW